VADTNGERDNVPAEAGPYAFGDVAATVVERKLVFSVFSIDSTGSRIPPSFPNRGLRPSRAHESDIEFQRSPAGPPESYRSKESACTSRGSKSASNQTYYDAHVLTHQDDRESSRRRRPKTILC
jgi:hypothetical protein